MENFNYHKMNYDRIMAINKASKKLESLLQKIGYENFSTFMVNNPVIHDSYHDGFYVYKYITKGYSIRLLYRYDGEILEIHKAHFKKGDKDNSKYIDDFKFYVSQYQTI